jgi:hypothetical protein
MMSEKERESERKESEWERQKERGGKDRQIDRLWDMRGADMPMRLLLTGGPGSPFSPGSPMGNF